MGKVNLCKHRFHNNRYKSTVTLDPFPGYNMAASGEDVSYHGVGRPLRDVADEDCDGWACRLLLPLGVRGRPHRWALVCDLVVVRGPVGPHGGPGHRRHGRCCNHLQGKKQKLEQSCLDLYLLLVAIFTCHLIISMKVSAILP